jgi:hypothetical protein
VLRADQVSVVHLQYRRPDVAQVRPGVRGHGVNVLPTPVRAGEVDQQGTFPAAFLLGKGNHVRVTSDDGPSVHGFRLRQGELYQSR